MERCEEIQLIPNAKPQPGNKATIDFKKLTNNLNHHFADDRPNFASPDGKVFIQTAKQGNYTNETGDTSEDIIFEQEIIRAVDKMPDEK